MNCRKRSNLASSKVFIRWWPGFRHGFGAEALLPLTQGAPAISHNTTILYWMVFNLYECHIRSDTVTALFWIFFIYSLSFAGVSPILVKNVEVAFEIKPRHPISRGNMSIDQSFLIHCSHGPSYFSNFRWCAQSMLVSKGIVNSAIIPFFELTDQAQFRNIRIFYFICLYAILPWLTFLLFPKKLIFLYLSIKCSFY